MSDSGSYGCNTPPFEDSELFPGADNLQFGYVKNYCWEENFIKEIKDDSSAADRYGAAAIILGAIFIHPTLLLAFTPSSVTIEEVWIRRICNFSIYDRSTGELVDTIDAVVAEIKDEEATKELWHEQHNHSGGSDYDSLYHPKGEDDFDQLAEEYFAKKRGESSLHLSEKPDKIGDLADEEDKFYEFTLYAADPNILDNVDELYLIHRVNIEGKTGYFTDFTQTKLSLGQPITPDLLKKVLIGSKQTMKVRDDCIYIPEIIEPQGQPRRYSRNLKMGIIPNTQYKVYFKTKGK